MPIRDMCNTTVVALEDNETVVSNAPAYLLGVYVNTVLSANALPILDGETSKFVIPAGAVAGAMYDFMSARFSTSIVINPDDGATGNVTVLWAPA